MLSQVRSCAIDVCRNKVAELVASGEEEKLVCMLGTRLAFGTAGLRGQMGPGFNAMNVVTVQQTSQGLCRCVLPQEDANPPSLHRGRPACSLCSSAGTCKAMSRARLHQLGSSLVGTSVARQWGLI